MTAFAGRTLDLQAFAAPAGGSGRLTVVFPTKLLAGPAKAVQRFIHMLLTRRGSIKGDPGFGTTFLADVQLTGGSDQSDERVRAVFQRAVGQLFEWDQQHADELAELEDDERVARAELTQVSVLDDTVSMVVRLELSSTDPVTYIEASVTVPKG